MSKRYIKNKKDRKSESFATPADVTRIQKANDPSWYGDDQLLKDAASLSFFNALGAKIDEENQPVLLDTTGENSANLDSPSGIMAIHYIPGVGYSEDKSSPINLAAKKLYSYIRHANSGSKNYDSPDLIQYIIAKSSADSFIAYLKRIYGCIMKYNGKNRYLPEVLVQAMNVDVEDIQSHLADFRALINVTISKLNALYIPADFTYYLRQTFLNTSVFTDSESTKAQLYLFVPDCVWQFNGSGENVGNLTPVNVGRGAPLNFYGIQEICNNLLQDLVSSEDINIMSGDILKCYGEDKILKLSYMAEDYTIDFKYSPEVLDQIHNTTLVGDVYDMGRGTTNNYIAQDASGTIIYKPTFQAAWGEFELHDEAETPYTFGLGQSKSLIFDLGKDNPSPADVMVASRMTSTQMMDYDSQQGYYYLKSFGTEIATRAVIYAYDNFNEEFTATVIYNGECFSKDDINLLLPVITKLNEFEMSPLMFYVYGYESNVDDIPTGVSQIVRLGDITNFTFITRETLDKMHQCAILHEFNVPAK